MYSVLFNFTTQKHKLTKVVPNKDNNFFNLFFFQSRFLCCTVLDLVNLQHFLKGKCPALLTPTAAPEHVALEGTVNPIYLAQWLF